MKEVMEVLFDVTYLITVIAMGVMMLRGAEGRKQIKLFGIMTLVLGFGDAFHLVPRVYALCTDGLANHYQMLGFGQFFTSITMTIFYVILYHIAKLRYKLTSKALDVTVYVLAISRILLCLCPKDEWMSMTPPEEWGIYRNIPFLILGILMIVLFYQEARKTSDTPLKWMWLAITLSFGFYIPVVLWADVVPALGALMIPKTVAYVWIVYMGISAMKSDPLPDEGTTDHFQHASAKR